MATNRIKHLDGLRGILALIVFIHHLLFAFFPEVIFGGAEQEFMNTSQFNLKRLFALSPINILFNPGMAILFFFLMSGYVQTKVYFEKNSLVFLQKSFIKRYFRLAIPTVFVVFMVYVFHKLHLIHSDRFPVNNLSNDWAKSLLPDNLSFLAVLYNGAFECFVTNSRYYQILWTMPIELLNSFIVLMLALATHNLKNRIWLFGAWLFVQLFFLHSYNGAAFTFGMMIGYFQTNTLIFNGFFSRTYVKFLCWVLGVYFASYPYTGYQNAVINSIYKPISFFEVYPHIISYLIGVILLFCALSCSTKTQKLLSHKVCTFFGNISFMLYLVHFVLLFSFSPWIFQKLLPVTSFGTNLLLTGVSSFVIISVTSYLLYRLIDKPVVEMCNKITTRVFGV